MLFKIPNGNIKECFESLWKGLDEKPINKPFPQHKMKYLGHYIGLQGDLENPEAFQVYDLYMYEGSRFQSVTFLAKYGEQDSDYVSECIEALAKMENKELKNFAVGEAYRRFKKRQPCNGTFNHFH